MKESSKPYKFYAPSVRLIFITSVALLAVFYFLTFIVTKRLPMGHDTLQYFQLQYTFLNELIVKGELPRWFPFMTKGTVTNIWFLLQNSLLSNIYYVIAPLLESVNYYYLFYFSLFFEECVLIAGTLLLSQLFYKNTWSICFVVIAVIGSINWGSQIWWSFHLYYLFPLVLYIYIRSLIERSLKHFVLGNMLLIVWSFYGNLPYYLPVLSFFVFLSMFWYVIFNSYDSKMVFANISKKDDGRQILEILLPQFKLFPIGFKHLGQKNSCKLLLKWIFVIILSGIPLLIIHKFLTESGAHEIVYGNYLRGVGGKVNLSDFLSYASFTYNRFIEIVTGVPTTQDQTIYVGAFTLSFFFLSIYLLFKKILINRIAIAFIVTILFMISFALGGGVATLSYFLWPFMDMFRHVGLIGSLIKILIIFVAGFAIDMWIASIERDHLNISHDILNKMFLILSLILIGKVISISIPFRSDYQIFMNAKNTILYSNTISILLIMIGLIFLMYLKGKSIKTHILLFSIPIIFFIHAFEMTNYKYVFNSITMPVLKTKIFFNSFSYQDYPYPEERSMNYEKNERFLAFKTDTGFSFKDFKNQKYAIANKWGSLYWNYETFFCFDACSSIFRADHRLDSIDNYYKAYGDEFYPLNIEQPMPMHPAFLKIIGCNFPKIQIFKRMYFSEEVDKLIASPLYKGDVLLTDSKGADHVFASITSKDVSRILQENERLDIPVYVNQFSSNAVRMELLNNRPDPVILHYADAYHKYWKAFVNGNETNIYRSNRGFKAIVVPPGKATIDFVFFKQKLIYAKWFFILFGIGGVIIIMYYTLQLFRKEQIHND